MRLVEGRNGKGEGVLKASAAIGIVLVFENYTRCSAFLGGVKWVANHGKRGHYSGSWVDNKTNKNK